MMRVVDFKARFASWLALPSPADQVIVSARRIFVLPTQAGFFYGLALLAMLLVSVNYNLALGYAMVFWLFALALVGLIAAARNLWGLSIYAGRPEAVFCGETAHFPLFLRHNRPEPRPDLALRFRRQRASLFSWPPFKALTPLSEVERTSIEANGQVRVDISLQTHQRGWQRLPALHLSTHFPLGLFLAWCYPPLKAACLVYPRPIDWPMQTNDRHPALGNLVGERGEDDFAGLRERQPAESLRRVDWKAAARLGPERPLYVKQFAGGNQSTEWLDWQSLTGMDNELRLSVLCAWVIAHDRAGNRYGLSIPGTVIEAGSGHDHHRRCLEALSLFGTDNAS